jgi:isocitrate/isopropylmalate dehydrogenase
LLAFIATEMNSPQIGQPFEKILLDGRLKTADLGGTATTTEVSAAIVAALGQ